MTNPENQSAPPLGVGREKRRDWVEARRGMSVHGVPRGSGSAALQCAFESTFGEWLVRDSPHTKEMPGRGRTAIGSGDLPRLERTLSGRRSMKALQDLRPLRPIVDRR